MDKAPAIAQAKTTAVAAAEQAGHAANPFKRDNLPGHVNAGTVSIEVERAIAEVQASLIIAKRFPRDPYAAWEAVMTACSRPGLAEEAFYSYKRGGENVTGPSIRLAEEMARCWGNIDYGMRELSNKDGVTELEAYAWDKETNTSSTQRFTVRHMRDTRNGSYELKDQRDIYELGANMGSRRMRARILAILPQDLVAAAEEQCRKTLKGMATKPMADQVKDLVAAFSTMNVTGEMIERYIGKKRADFIDDDMITMRGVYKSIRDGMGTVASFFSAPAIEQPAGAESTSSKPANDNKQQGTATQQQEGAAPKVENPAGGSKRNKKSQKQEEPPAQEQPVEEQTQQEDAGGNDDSAAGAGDDDFDGMFGKE